MKRFLILLLAVPAFAQSPVIGGSVQYVTTAPSGACVASPPVKVLFSTGVIYTCDNGTWAASGGGGGPTFAYPTGTGFTIVTGGAAWGTTLADPLAVAHGGTGTASTLTGLMRGNASAMTAAELSGDATTSGSNAVTLATVNSGSGACGDATHVCAITTNAKGLVTAQTATAISGGGAWTNLSGTITPTNMTCTATSCTTSGTQSTVTFAAIPTSGYNSIVIKYVAVGSTVSNWQCQFHGDTGSNYANQGYQNQNVTFTNIAQLSQSNNFCGILNTSASSGTIELPFYTVTAIPRQVHLLSGGFASVSSATNNYVFDIWGLWNNTANAIDSVKLTNSSGTVASGATFVIYGVN
jgi:hypothetical protein